MRFLKKSESIVFIQKIFCQTLAKCSCKKLTEPFCCAPTKKRTKFCIPGVFINFYHHATNLIKLTDFYVMFTRALSRFEVYAVCFITFVLRVSGDFWSFDELNKYCSSETVLSGDGVIFIECTFIYFYFKDIWIKKDD